MEGNREFWDSGYHHRMNLSEMPDLLNNCTDMSTYTRTKLYGIQYFTVASLIPKKTKRGGVAGDVKEKFFRRIFFFLLSVQTSLCEII